MRIALFGAGLFAAVAGLALGAGQASAGVPIVQPDQGRIGMHLSHEETAMVASGPLPAVVSMFVPLNRMGAGLHPETRIYRDDNGGVHASLRQVLMEAAQHPDGSVVVFLNAPGTRGGRVLDVYQNWTR
ncbi:hypothetical protein IU501_32235 [Nocardia otitidiscaviarum]|uniref:Uncharacterized protein n=1 Tax=Nocardia otitidiscaviarum TaxID=1823 RepID=A0A378YBB7_9NOCA|nr:hypothetical protein [Nocardia otitidiscaviarum]MBF6137645.1 hypothetical protein [Nocardia otitidiscaviarum]MBF6183001.1 hypothetical protein [Nocardia otitidiscaviarum]MBF6239944.1 hypothetical protein [Nocardia otitidiscaviarum]MBF6488553.1 hypothetical protein [Nocardia otitidiscaviarum]SUA73677.1 Uncharacterised protein [Nocardia otitidiscaviarum]